MAAQLNPKNMPGFQEYLAACDFLSAADALVHRYEEGGVPSPRALVNLTFLGLEIVLKSHIRRLTAEEARGHDIAKLFGKLRNDPLAVRAAATVESGYAAVLGALGLPAYNQQYPTVNDLFALLTQKTFGEWRYVYEQTEKLPVGEGLTFPFFNVYLTAWVFVSRAAEEYRDAKFPLIREYGKMPMWFDVKRRSRGEVLWSAETRFVAFDLRKRVGA